MPPGGLKPGERDDGDIYVVVALPTGTFANAIPPHGAPLHEEDLAIEAFPSSPLHAAR